MRLLIVGSKGQVGTELVRQSAHHMIHAVDHDLLDITDARAVKLVIDEFKPDVVINAAAYTAVDKAESEPEVAFAVNRDGPKNLAVACAGLDIPLIHYSTDYVFDGSKQNAYTEKDNVCPLGVYGESKLAGEQAVQQYCPKHLIFRTSWVFSAHGNNFVKTMLKLASERDELGVVADQYGKPSSAAELARLTLDILPRLNNQWGIYHMAQPEMTSWHGFSKTIFSTARSLGAPLKIQRVKAIATEDYPTPASRPANSTLNCKKLELTFDVSINPWATSLYDVIQHKMQKYEISKGIVESER